MTLVTLTFDDGLDSQLDSGVAILDRYGLRGTFFVPVGNGSFLRRHQDWRVAVGMGHELGNHTVFHPGVSTKAWVTEGIALERYSLDRMRRELVMANDVLQMVDGRDERTFAFPCSNPWLGYAGWPRRALTKVSLERTRIMGWVDRLGLDWGSSLTDYTPEVRELFVAARCGGAPVATISVVPDDRFRVRGVEGDGLATTELNAIVDAAIERNCWLVLVFHGVGGGHHLYCDTDAFESLARRLADDSRVEVLTFLEASKRIWSRSANE